MPTRDDGIVRELSRIADALTRQAHGGGWLSIVDAAVYSGVSVGLLRRYLGHEAHPLPAHRVGGKWLVSRDDLDAWVRGFPRAGEDIEVAVRELLDDLEI